MSTTVVPELPRLILPPGWTLVPVGPDNSAAAAEVLAPLRAAGPRDSVVPFVRELERTLTPLLDEAHGAGSFAVALPLGIPWEVPVSTSIALSALTPDVGVATLPTGPEQIDTDAGAARRRVVSVPVPEGASAEELVLLRTIEYTWVRGDAYIVAFSSISGLADPDYAPITDALTLLITTMLDALTWPDPEGPAVPPGVDR
ncbi:hypothetical protein [Microbacterium dextranolyticum]|uniref:Uncharacterized protein n=1 Tax=Microbacterium dextranolyticum TaxID=36806 RepID=A0A9W6HLB6_9MICO|nr:hypothetical protein [Microbacterium dextranolyticum]MBM7463865.1 hypothetical protein [Microbacterium dextranolyticum]GLJ94947.1 hypothetical protein GCM10017591_10090 [Microbacterium dextranolyticum]